MDFEKLTDRARGFLQAAQTIAVREHHQRIAPAHLLKALLDDEQGMAAGLIGAAGGDAKAAKREVDVLVAKVPAVTGSGVPVDLLAHVVRNVVVMRVQERLHCRLASIRPASFERDRGHAFLDETVMIGPDEIVLVRLRIGRKLDAHLRGGTAHGSANARMLCAQSDDIREVVGQDRHVEIDVRDRLASGQRVFR